MKEIVLKVEFYGDKIKQRAMKVASSISGVVSIGVEVEDKKMTIVGEIDAVKAVRKLRKLCPTDIVSVEEKKDKEEEANNKQDPPEEAVVQAHPYSDVHGYCYFHNYYPAPLSCYYYQN